MTFDGSVFEEGLDEIRSTENFGRPAESDGDSTDDGRLSGSVGALLRNDAKKRGREEVR